MQLVNMHADANWSYAKSLGRAFAGAIIFSLPLLMTMEMWWLGFYMERDRLLQFLLVNFLMLVVLARLSGFEPTVSWADDALDAFAAFGVAVLSAAVLLALFGVLTAQMPASEIVGKVAVQAVPASFGAMLAGKQLGHGEDESDVSKERARSSYAGQLALMLAGALFLAYNVAPTEEMMLISYMMSPWHSIALVLLSILLLHAFVYALGFKGEKRPRGANGFLALFARFSIVGYGIAVLASFYVLWTFGRMDGVSIPQLAGIVAVLGFPAAIGAAIARLVV